MRICTRLAKRSRAQPDGAWASNLEEQEERTSSGLMPGYVPIFISHESLFSNLLAIAGRFEINVRSIAFKKVRSIALN